MVKGFTFQAQRFTSQDWAHVINTFFSKKNGITQGCEISNTDSEITIQDGRFITYGRLSGVVGLEKISVEPTVSGELFARLVYEVDLTKANTAEEFNQGSFKILTNVVNYPTLVKEDLDDGGQVYQLLFAEFKIGVLGINSFADRRLYLNFDSAQSQLSAQIESLINNISVDNMPASIVSIEDIEGFFTGANVEDALEEIGQKVLNLENDMPDLFQSVSSGKALIASSITDKGITTASDAEFSVMANNIDAIETKIDPPLTADAGDVLVGRTFSKDGKVTIVGTMPNRGAVSFTPTDTTQTGAEGYYSGITVNPRPSLTGDALASHVLGGKRFYSSSYSKQTGSMVNRGDVDYVLPINGSFNIAQGYHNGSGNVTQSVPTKSAQSYKPSTVNEIIAAGKYLTGHQTILGDANYRAENIKKGVSMWDKTGTLDETNITGTAGGYTETANTEIFRHMGSGVLTSISVFGTSDATISVYVNGFLVLAFRAYAKYSYPLNIPYGIELRVKSSTSNVTVTVAEGSTNLKQTTPNCVVYGSSAPRTTNLLQSVTGKGFVIGYKYFASGVKIVLDGVTVLDINPLQHDNMGMMMRFNSSAKFYSGYSHTAQNGMYYILE